MGYIPLGEHPDQELCTNQYKMLRLKLDPNLLPWNHSRTEAAMMSCISNLTLFHLLPLYCNMIDFKDSSTGKVVDQKNLRRNFEDSQWVSKISDNIFIKAINYQRHWDGVEKAAYRYYDLIQWC